jgi:hypothetical protein
MLNSNIIRNLTITLLGSILLLLVAIPAGAQSLREFRPLPRTELYEREFLDDFFVALGNRPQGLTWVDESATVNLLVTGSVYAQNGDAENALLTFGMIPDYITSTFPFFTTMREDLLVPDILDPWYDYEEAREFMFGFYTDVWLPNPGYRDDYISFRDDTMGRASRRDPTVPAVWILGHLADYGFVSDRALTEDDPYLFLWDLLSSITVYAQRSTYYGLDWDRYNENDYNVAIVMRVAAIVNEAHQEAARLEAGRGFWADLIDSHRPFEPPTEGVESTGEVTPVGDSLFSLPSEATSQPGPTEPQVIETVEESYSDLFRPPDEIQEYPGDAEDRELELEERIEALAYAVGARLEPGETTELPVDEITEPFTEVPGSEETIDIPVEPVTEPDRTPSETMPEATPPSELGNYAQVRLNEIADQLAIDIGTHANELGRETIDLVVLYNDTNVTDETIVNAEQRYVAKREAFLAGLAVWDRFNMEIFTPLTLAEFNDLIAADLNSPYSEVRSSSTQWSMYQAYEAHFDEAFGQIENGLRNRREEPDVLAAEAAALTAFLGDYNDLIKEIEDLLSGAITEAPAEPAE